MSDLNETVATVQAVDISSGLASEGLSSFLAGIYSNGLLGVGIFIALLAGGVLLHRLNMDRTDRKSVV